MPARLFPACVLLALSALLMPSGRALAQAAGAEEIRLFVNEGNYREALQKIAAALALRGDAGKSVDRFALYMLKAECHLRMKAPTLAAEAYGLAVKEAADDKSRNLASAHQLLMQRQRGLAYRPVRQEKGRPPVTIDIVDPASRKQAFAALLADEMASLQPRLAQARRATGLAPIFELFKLIPRLEGIERAAIDSPAGAAPQTQKLLGELAEQSRRLIEAALKDMAKHVSAIDKQANQFVEIVRQVPDPTHRSPFGIRYKLERAYRKKGPSDEQLQHLHGVSETCDQAGQASRMLAEGVPELSKGFERLITESERINKEVARILDVDYTTVYDEPPVGARAP